MKKVLFFIASILVFLAFYWLVSFSGLVFWFNGLVGVNFTFFSYISWFAVVWSFGFIVLWKRFFKLSVLDSFGSSRWLTNFELRRTGFLSGGGVVLGMTSRAKYSFSSKTGKWKFLKPGLFIFNDEPEHILIVAPTRKGKGINNVIPTLLSWTGSVICYDIKKENYDVTSGWRRKFSHVIRFEPTSDTSARFNPLFEIEKGASEVPQVQNLVEILTNPYGKSEKDHWNISASQLLTGMILHVLYAEKDKSLYGVYAFLNNPESDIEATLTRMLETKHLGSMTHPAVAQTARNMLNKAENELSSIVSTASSYLSLYQDPIIARNTSASDFTVDQLQHGDFPASLFLVINPADAERMKPLVRLMLQMSGTKLTRKLHGDKHKLLYLIDEFPSLGNLEFFETQLAFFAGYKIKCMLIIQSYSQLYKHYTRDTSIPDNCRFKVILGADNADEAERISKFLGVKTLIRTSRSRADKILPGSRSLSESEGARNLMLPDEILRMPFDEILILFGGAYPCKAKKVMYFLDSRLASRANLPTPETAGDEAEEFLEDRPAPWLELEKSSRPEEDKDISSENSGQEKSEEKEVPAEEPEQKDLEDSKPGESEAPEPEEEEDGEDEGQKSEIDPYGSVEL